MDSSELPVFLRRRLRDDAEDAQLRRFTGRWNENPDTNWAGLRWRLAKDVRYHSSSRVILEWKQQGSSAEPHQRDHHENRFICVKVNLICRVRTQDYQGSLGKTQDRQTGEQTNRQKGS